MKIQNKIEPQQIALNHPSDIDFKDFNTIYRNVLLNHISFLVNYTTLATDIPLRFIKNLFNI